MAEISRLPLKYGELAELHEAIMALVDQFAGRVPVLGVLGALRYAEHTILSQELENAAGN